MSNHQILFVDGTRFSLFKVSADRLKLIFVSRQKRAVVTGLMVKVYVMSFQGSGY